MIAVGIIMIWGGYGLASYGWVLAAGYNITARQWFSPLNPYRWPAGGKQPAKIPQGQMWPGKGGTSTDSAGGGGGGGGGTTTA